MWMLKRFLNGWGNGRREGRQDGHKHVGKNERKTKGKKNKKAKWLCVFHFSLTLAVQFLKCFK